MELGSETSPIARYADFAHFNFWIFFCGRNLFEDLICRDVGKTSNDGIGSGGTKEAECVVRLASRVGKYKYKGKRPWDRFAPNFIQCDDLSVASGPTARCGS